MEQNVITSAKNPLVKHVKKLLTSSKQRKQENLAVAEGVHLAMSLMGSGASPRMTVCAASALENPEVASIDAQLERQGVTSIILSDKLFESISDIHAGVGILVVFAPPLTAEQPESLQDKSLLLEDIQDPGNLGTIFRTAAAAGITSVYLSEGTASAWSPKALRAGMGAQFGIDIYEGTGLGVLVENASINVYATDLSSESSLYQADLVGPCAWIFGNEGQGVSAELLERCTVRLTIPQTGATIESLNVSAAVAVCLFEQQRQRLIKMG